MTFDNGVIKNDEKAIFKLRSLYQKYGYKQYKMSKFEEYDFYAKNKDFLVSDGIITFTDTNGRLMALKPDVTLSIIKNSQSGTLNKVYYNENVYRVSDGTHSFKEIMQTGLECIGDIDAYNICEVIMLAIKSLAAISDDYVMDISHMKLISLAMDELGITRVRRDKLLKCIGEKNHHELKTLCEEYSVSSEKLIAIAAMNGSGDDISKKLRSLNLGEDYEEVISELELINSFLKENNLSDKVRYDFSIVNDMNYYSGVVFKGYINGIFQSVLSGGQYGSLMERMGKKCDAIGFAVYLDTLERFNYQSKKYDVDIIILYDENADVSKLSQSIKMLTDNGSSVLALKKADNIKYRQLLKFDGKGVEILETND